MDLKTAFAALRAKLDAVDGLPACDLNPRSPESTASFPALYLAVEEENRGEPADLRWIQAKSSVAVIFAYVYVQKTGTDHLAVTILEKTALVETAVSALTATAPGFTCRVVRIEYVYSENASWAAAKLHIETGAYL